MASFSTTVAGLPLLQGISAQTLEGLIERAVMDVAGRHRWPFLLKVQQELTWAANDAIQSFHDIARLWSVMIPDASDNYYRLRELSDLEFQKWIEANPSEDTPRVWRDAGMDGDKYQIEIFPAPDGAKTLKVDYTLLPDASKIDDLPGRFQSLVMLAVQAMASPATPFLLRNYETAVQTAIARETDLQGKRWRMGRDPVQASRWRNINNPA